MVTDHFVKLRSSRQNAAKLLSKLGEEAGVARVNPLRAKKLFVLAALEVERMRKKMLSTATAPDATRTAAQTLESLMTQAHECDSEHVLSATFLTADVGKLYIILSRSLERTQ